MKALGWAAAAVLLGLSVSATGASPSMKAATEAKAAEEELKQITRELLAAVAPGNWSMWDRYLDDSVVYFSEAGRALTKVQLREEFKPLPQAIRERSRCLASRCAFTAIRRW